MESIKNISDKSCLVILDGFGINDDDHKNAIKHANTPNIDRLFKEYPFTTIEAGGVSVGLPKGVCGNSEVGHMNLGAGRPVRQDFVRINEAIEQETFHQQDNFQHLIKHAKKNNNRVHLLGLLSDGGVHSHLDHLVEIVNRLREENILVLLHAFLDGRDTPPKSATGYIQTILDLEGIEFASMQGRSIGMDRDRRWEKIQTCYDMMLGCGNKSTLSPLEYLNEQYGKNITDEFIEAVLFNDDYKMKDEEALFFINFRPDRAIQISLAFNDPEFNSFPRPWTPGFYLCMSPYIPDEVELPILFDKEKIAGCFSEYLSEQNKKQFKIAETEKYAHITFFFNGGTKTPFPGEDQALVPSPKEVTTYDQKPEMSAPQVTSQLVKALQNNEHDFYLVNFANSDMVGHTGKFEAAIKAIEQLDKSLEAISKVCLEKNISLVITADHGNSDQMVYPNGDPHTSHTGSPVPFSVIHPSLKGQEISPQSNDKALKDVAPTLIHLMGLPMPELFTGESVFP